MQKRARTDIRIVLAEDMYDRSFVNQYDVVYEALRDYHRNIIENADFSKKGVVERCHIASLLLFKLVGDTRRNEY